MSEPMVCAVCLVNGRPDMVRRAVASFRSQTYRRDSLASLLLFNTGGRYDCDEYEGDPDIMPVWSPNESGLPLGRLRNSANALTTGGLTTTADIIVHWDSDDFSSPQRIAEQVELLQLSGADVVGYREMLFYREPMCFGTALVTPLTGEAWLYSSPNPAYCLGASLAYRRESWERHPFPNVNAGEDTLWMLNFKSKRVRSCSSVREDRAAAGTDFMLPGGPRMIASIHGGNLSSAITPGVREWRRVPQFDAICSERMRL